MKAFKQFFGGLLFCLVEAAIGILLLINPVDFTGGIIIAGGVIALLAGIISVIRYFRTHAEEAAAGKSLSVGLALILAGGFCVLNPYWFISAFPVIAVLYGIAVLLGGIGKIQWAVDMLRARKGKWIFAAIGAVISVVCGIVILSNPFTTTAVLWMFTGISMICEAVVDLITFIFSGFKKKVKEDPAGEEDFEDAEPVEENP